MKVTLKFKNLRQQSINSAVFSDIFTIEGIFMKKVFKVLKKILDIFCWVIIAVLVASVIISVIARFNGTVPSVFGYSVYRVSSGSMEPELKIGDVILGKSVDNPESIKVGDIVTYKGSGELTGMFITHKVIVAPHEENGELMLQTKGIANEVADSPINVDRVQSVVICEIEFLAHFYNFFFSSWGLLAIIALIILVFIDELVNLVKTIAGVKPKNKQANIDDIIGKIQSENEVDSADSKLDEEN